MRTRDGRQVNNLTFVKELNCYIGEVDGKKMTWNKSGRFANNYRTKNDLVTKVYVNVRKWSGKIIANSTTYFSAAEAIANRGNGYIKTIEVEL